MTTQPQPPETAPDWNWPQERARIAAAFAVKPLHHTPILGIYESDAINGGYSLSVHLRAKNFIEIGLDFIAINAGAPYYGAWVEFDSKGKISEKESDTPNAGASLDRGLTMLGYEVEGVTAHERLEWLLEMKRAGFEVPQC